MHSVMTKKLTLCGMMAGAVIIAAGSSVPMMLGGCGANETILCPPYEDAGADDGGHGGDSPTSTSSSLCD